MITAIKGAVRRRALLALAFTSLFSSKLSAQEQRWFEIEMLIFSQTPPATLQEQFSAPVTPVKPGRAYDLLTPLLQADISALLTDLPLCQQPAVEPFSIMLQHSLVLPRTMPRSLCVIEAQPKPWQLSHVMQQRVLNTKLPYPQRLTAVITGSGEHRNSPYLADAAALQFSDIASKIRRLPGAQILLHTAWRQAPVTERRAIASRWFAGTNYSQQFDYWGQPRASGDMPDLANLLDTTAPAMLADDSTENEMLGNIELLLQQLQANSQLPAAQNSQLDSISTDTVLTANQLPDQVWQLDGLFKLHLDHYLFVNTEFNLRQPGQDSLNTIYVRQSRRVISGEVHYLDHPYLGIVLQIRRYEPPQPDNGTQIEQQVLTE
jgi:hypothetical protein